MPRKVSVASAVFAALGAFGGFGFLLQGQVVSPTAPVSSTAQAGAVSGPALLRAKTRLVLVDVMVRDRSGHPVHGLTRENFRLTENKTAESLRSFEEFNAETSKPVRGPELPQFPPGTFTDYQPVATNGPLNILLIDRLNTPTDAQAYLQDQLRHYLRKAPAGTRIAIFGLNAKLSFLQGFTADPAVLRAAVDHKLGASPSDLLDDPGGSSNQTSASDELASMNGSAHMQQATADIVAQVQQFEAQTQAYQLQLRIQYTIDAFDELAHYLSAFPGRKNLLWFSGSFPIGVLPDASLGSSFAVVQDKDPEFREMSNLLASSQVSVYPVDARGLETLPAYDASRSGQRYARTPGQTFSKDLSTANSAREAEHQTMQELADDTGGQAFYNDNDLASAVSNVIESGSNFYSLSYSPQNHKEDGGARRIHLELAGVAGAQEYRLFYRKGYFAEEPDRTGHPGEPGAADQPPAGANTRPAYVTAAMSRGAPAPSELLFDVRVLPASKKTEDSVAPQNHLVAEANVKGPFRRYDVDFAALPQEFTLTPTPDGRRAGEVEFLTYVFDADGRLLNVAGAKTQLDLSPRTYAALLQNGMRVHLEVSAPATGQSYLRLAVHDIPSRKMGVVEVPTASVSQLEPPQAPPAAAATAAKSPDTGALSGQSAPGSGTVPPHSQTAPNSSPK